MRIKNKNIMESQLVVGIDVGGQTTKLGVVDARGTVLAQTVIRTDTYDTVEPYIDELAEALKKIIREAGAEGNVRGIGVGAPNGNYYTGSIADAPNIAWGRNGTIPFAKLLSAKIGGLPVALTNDANAAAVGEMTYGAARGMKNFIMITLGTGVGSGIVVNGEIASASPVVCEEMTVDEAKAQGAVGVFGDRYGEVVKVYTIGHSKEICGGPHAANTAELGKFRIVKEQSSSAGVRRIKAVLE